MVDPKRKGQHDKVVRYTKQLNTKFAEQGDVKGARALVDEMLDELREGHPTCPGDLTVIATSTTSRPRLVVVLVAVLKPVLCIRPVPLARVIFF